MCSVEPCCPNFRQPFLSPSPKRYTTFSFFSTNFCNGSLCKERSRGESLKRREKRERGESEEMELDPAVAGPGKPTAQMLVAQTTRLKRAFKAPVRTDTVTDRVWRRENEGKEA